MRAVGPIADTQRSRSAAEAFAVARRKFMAGERLDMKALAAELGVDRSTLFRYVGNRDELIVSILTSLWEPTFREIAATAEGTGGARVARVMGRFAQAMIDAPYYSAFLQREPERALRLITTKSSPIQQRVVAAFEGLLQQEADRGNFRHPMRLHDLAYLVVRIGESFIYADLITGATPDSAVAEQAIATLLHADGGGEGVGGAPRSKE
jgi:AcrR family transcriptional regulator